MVALMLGTWGSQRISCCAAAGSPKSAATSLDLPKSVAKRQVQQCNPAHSVPELLDGESDSPCASAFLALQQVNKHVQRNMYITMKFNRAALHDLTSLLKPLPQNVYSEEFFSLAWEPESDLPAISDAGAMALPDHGQTRPLRELLAGAGSALADEFVAASVTHEMQVSADTRGWGGFPVWNVVHPTTQSGGRECPPPQIDSLAAGSHARQCVLSVGAFDFACQSLVARAAFGHLGLGGRHFRSSPSL